jgi:hypothetical protein
MGVPSFLSHVVGRRSSSSSPRKSSATTSINTSAASSPSNKRLAGRGDETSGSDDDEDFLPLVASSTTTTATTTSPTRSNGDRPETPKQRKLRKSSKSLRKFLSSPKSLSFNRRRPKSDDPQETDAKTLMTAGWSVLEDDEDDDYFHTSRPQEKENDNNVDEFLEDQAVMNDQRDFFDVPENLVTHSVAQWNPKQGIAFTYSL